MHALLPTGVVIFGLSFFLDLLDLSLGRVVWVLRTLRFWLYFILHFGISCLAAYLIHTKITDWFLLAPAATFLGVSIISNTNIKIAGLSLVPIADVFQATRAKMFEQAANEKLEQASRATLASRLRKLTVPQLEQIYRDIMVGDVEVGEAHLEKARKKSEDSHRASLIGYILKANATYVEQHIEEWDPKPPAAPSTAAPAPAVDAHGSTPLVPTVPPAVPPPPGSP
jgi:hypothetical protein